MNVLILTPDAVGSTLLQRTLTIYMTLQQFDRPVINLHELTNGLAKYYSPEFNQEIVSKKSLQDWGYFQTLQQVVELLSSVDHYKTSRLAHYHIQRRGDTLEQQIPFYNYLNENFYIIACRRNNIFEHALSMTLNAVTKKLNVYSPHEKIETFHKIYRSGIELDEQVFVRQLNQYKNYISWSEQHFNIGSYFNYERDVPKIENFILDLPMFANFKEPVTWQKNFGITFNSWNKMHYARSDIGNLLLENPQEVEQLVLEQPGILEYYQTFAPEPWPAVHSNEDINNLPAVVKTQLLNQYIQTDGILSLLPQKRQENLAHLREGYTLAQNTIEQMVNLGIVISGPPIKKQTLGEKRKIVKNFDALTEIYNAWAEVHPELGKQITDDGLIAQAQQETQFWLETSSTLINC